MQVGSPRILILRLGAFGDVVNSLVVANLLRQRYPDAYIAWVVHPLASGILEGHPALNRVHVLPRRGLLRGALGLVRQLRRQRFDVAVDLSRSFKSGCLSWLSGAIRRVGFDPCRSKEWNGLFCTETIAPGDPQEHVIYHYLDMAHHLGAEQAPIEWAIDVPAEAHRRMAQALAEREGASAIHGRRGTVALCLGASTQAKRWPPRRFGELVAALRRARIRVALVGGPGDRAVLHAAPGILAPGVLDLVGKTSLKELAALFTRVGLYVGCDTGPMHLAVAMGCPVVGLFGATNPQRTGPWGNLDRVVRKGVVCSPCLKRSCKFSDGAGRIGAWTVTPHECMRGIKADTVVEAIRRTELLDI